MDRKQGNTLDGRRDRACVLRDGRAFVVSDWYDTKAEAQSALAEIVGWLEFAA